MKPRALISVNHIPKKWSEKITSLTLTDYSGFQADSLELTLADEDGKINLPPTGALIGLKLGYAPLLADKGTYTVNEIDYNGNPGQLTIRAFSADFGSGFKAQKTKAWTATTLGEIINNIAIINKLIPACAVDLNNVPIDHVEQNNESDASFLTGLATAYGALTTVKNGHLLFMTPGSGKTASGLIISPETIKHTDASTYSYTEADRVGKYTGIKCQWYDINTAETKDVLVGEEGTVKIIKGLKSSKSQAYFAAKAEWDRTQASAETMAINLPIGRPELNPQTPIILIGFKQELTKKAWVASQLTHTLDGGLTTRLILNTKPK